MAIFTPRALPVLIGSLPLQEHAAAIELIMAHTPEIPLWPQLPVFRDEGMLRQFLPGLPGISEMDDRLFINTEKDEFEAEILAFYEEYLSVAEDAVDLADSRFTLSEKEAKGFFTFLDIAHRNKEALIALKGQITGPITFCTGLVDQGGKAIFYNDQLRDAAVKLLALKARWQTRRMKEIAETVLLFFDEPALAGLGSSAYITITADEIIACLAETFEAVRAEGGLVGVHVCANTEWPVIFDAGIDILSYDAYSFFDRLILYPEHLRSFLQRGGILATGIVPTDEELIDRESADSLVARWDQQTTQLEQLGISRDKIIAQTLITPSCGTGSISPDHARKVLEMTRDVSAFIRSRK
ncbi:hypothetical protein JWG42_04335 [Desulfoprunum benzoelyticum]|uniref:Methionine synthase n=1 Tax=Desulfoprunum benzoelyticum TaxID=1506996 RepID=A0A840USH4_9BACT|nr:hypothetical protein [Desulfoprunum benzoelyticum]MBB5347786.1 hypothetical protein [Desulfoprunum benzoelyticum]MBM9529378.1 hypothetical protein [Desulfoprunum benzoelyticum]